MRSFFLLFEEKSTKNGNLFLCLNLEKKDPVETILDPKNGKKEDGQKTTKVRQIFLFFFKKKFFCRLICRV
jgi:hypothetical protein